VFGGKGDGEPSTHLKGKRIPPTRRSVRFRDDAVRVNEKGRAMETNFFPYTLRVRHRPVGVFVHSSIRNKREQTIERNRRKRDKKKREAENF
jgi:hypothetical protein